MYNRILVAVDGSDTSNLALKEAIKLAKDQHSLLRLVHAVDLTLVYTDAAAPYVYEYQKALEAAGGSRPSTWWTAPASAATSSPR